MLTARDCRLSFKVSVFAMIYTSSRLYMSIKCCTVMIMYMHILWLVCSRLVFDGNLVGNVNLYLQSEIPKSSTMIVFSQYDI